MALDNIANLAEARRRKKGQDSPPPKDDRPVVRILAGELPATIDESEDALMLSDDGLFKQGARVVKIVLDKVKVSGGGDGSVLRLSEVSAVHLMERFTKAARFEKWDKRSDDWVTCNCPPMIAECYLSRMGEWKLPFLLGVITTPLLKPDGSVLDKPGYDPKTGILFNPQGVSFPKIKERPTREDAMTALQMLMRPIKEFPFANEASRSVALSAIITAVVRRSIPTAPMHAFSAPTAGSGKSLLIDVAAMIATGERAAVTALGTDRNAVAELEKKLGASMLAGDNVLSIDNVATPLDSAFLCQLLTQTTAKIRPLGRSENLTVPLTTSFYANGNNLTIAGDLTRRVLKGELTVDDERPETRKFGFDPVDMVAADRGEFVLAAITLARAYILSGESVSLPPLGSFGEWSAMVRNPLVWLGLEDPVKVMEEVRSGDPYLQRLRIMMDAWEAAYGSEEKRIRDVMKNALDVHPDNGELMYPDLKDALTAIQGGDGHHINAEKVSWWFRKNNGRVIDGRHFASAGSPSRPAWVLFGTPRGVEGGTASASEDGYPTAGEERVWEV